MTLGGGVCTPSGRAWRRRWSVSLDVDGPWWKSLLSVSPSVLFAGRSQGGSKRSLGLSTVLKGLDVARMPRALSDSAGQIRFDFPGFRLDPTRCGHSDVRFRCRRRPMRRGAVRCVSRFRSTSCRSGSAPARRRPLGGPSATSATSTATSAASATTSPGGPSGGYHPGAPPSPRSEGGLGRKESARRVGA